MKHVVSVSGGKDSTAAAILAQDEVPPEDLIYVFCDTGNEHELTLEYVHDYMPTVFGNVITVQADFAERIAKKRIYITNKWASKGVPQAAIDRALSVIQPTGNPFLDLCLWKGRFPSRMAQFCTQELKRRPMDDLMLSLLEQGHDLTSWRGIRRDESRNRSKAQEHEQAPEGWEIRHPIVAWTAQQTVDFVTGRGIKLNPLYSLGMGRVGCMPCINCNKDELLEISKRFPDHIDRIREWENLMCLASKRGWTTFFTDAAMEGEIDSQIFERLKIDSRILWAQTSHGGRQQDFIRIEAPSACNSLYGLCE